MRGSDDDRDGARTAQMSRRRLLGSGAAVLFLAACSDDAADNGAGGDSVDSTSSTLKTPSTATSGSDGTSGTGDQSGSTDEPAPLTPDDFAGLGMCTLLPEQMAGPFPLDEQFDRRDVTEGLPGRPMRLGFRVLDPTCDPIPGASVEIWHCDATGDYSAFEDGGGGKDEGEGTTFLRGTQEADGDGIVEFLTIVPGWYPGRAVHIHLRVRVDGNLVLTSQVYFDADPLAEVYRSEPYLEFGMPDTDNENDGIAGDTLTDGTLLHTVDAPTTAGPGTLALLNLAVDDSTVT